ncbi:MAG: MFS transporter [Pseudomonadota bacterium]
MINLRLFKNVLFSLNLIMGLLVFMVMAGVFIFPFYLELVLGYKTQEVGMIMMTVPVIMGLVAPVAGSLSDRLGVRGISLLGLVVVAAACLSIGTLHEGVSTLGYILRVAPLGLGMGLFVSPNNSAIMGAAPKDQLGVTSGLLALTRTLGHTSGIPLIGVIFTAQVLAAGGLNFFSNPALVPAEALVKGVNGTYHLAALVVATATILAAVAMWLDRRRNKLDQVSLERPAKEPVE